MNEQTMKTRNLTQVGRILQVLDKSFGLSFAEICTRLNESRDSMRKSMHYLYKEGRVNRAMDANGIQHYNITEKGKQHLAKELKGGTSVIKPLPAPKETIQPRANKTTEAWSNLVEEAEQRGFAKGYEQGVQAAQRAAYEQGKSSVIRKLTEFLS